MRGIREAISNSYPSITDFGIQGVPSVKKVNILGTRLRQFVFIGVVVGMALLLILSFVTIVPILRSALRQFDY